MDNQQNTPQTQTPELNQNQPKQPRSKKKILLTSLLVLLVLAAFGGLYYWMSSKNQELQRQLDSANMEIERLQVEEASGAEKPDTGSTPVTADERTKTEEAIVTAMNSKDYESLKSYMAETVTFARQSSDAGKENATQAEAIQAFNYFGPPPGGTNATTPWDFDVMSNDASFKSKIETANNPAFTDAYIGRSKDGGSFIAFKFNGSGKIVSFWYGFTGAL